MTANASAQAHPSDLELAALISSKICHDVIGPVGAIHNGLEILAEDDGADAQAYALDVIKNVTEQASARLQFARFAFGASGSAGALIDLQMARQLSEAFVNDGKRTLHWNGAAGHMPKNSAKLLLNMIASAVSTIPRGGTIEVVIEGEMDTPVFTLTCQGRGVRRPNFLGDLVEGQALEDIDSMSIQAYYTWRLAALAGMPIDITETDDAVIMKAA
ncbi:MAG: histidine phosphotransferase family protein [Pseudomonadota bacterium]